MRRGGREGDPINNNRITLKKNLKKIFFTQIWVLAIPDPQGIMLRIRIYVKNIRNRAETRKY